jgi:hypothetical protein
MSSLEVSPLSRDSRLLLSQKNHHQQFTGKRERFAATNHCPPVTPLFKGRRQILERLSAFFCARSGKERLRRREFLLYGMGGSGKSQIALKFAEKSRKRSVCPEESQSFFFFFSSRCMSDIIRSD